MAWVLGLGLSENLQCKSPQFLTQWWDLLEFSKKEKLFDMVYMHPGGVHTAMDLFLFWKSANMKHSSDYALSPQLDMFM